jgi:hypothetical protein
MKRWVPIFCVLMVTVAFAWGEIEVIAREFSLPTTYTVPSGKVLIIEHIQIIGGTDDRRFQISPQFGTDWVVRLPINTNTLYSFNPAFRVHGGWVIRPNTIGNTVSFFGVLADPEDLYAAVPSEIVSFAALPEGQLGGTVRVDGSGPVTVQIEGSGDLSTWSPEPDVTVKATMDAALREFQLPTPEDQKRFYRSNVRSRR